MSAQAFNGGQARQADRHRDVRGAWQVKELQTDDLAKKSRSCSMSARAGPWRFGGVFRPGCLDGGEDHFQQIRPRAPAPARVRRGARFRSPEGERQ